MAACDNSNTRNYVNHSVYGIPSNRVIKPLVRINGNISDIPEGYILPKCVIPLPEIELEGCEQLLTIDTVEIDLSPLFECLTVITGIGNPETAPTSHQYPLYSDTSTTPPKLWVWVGDAWVDPSNIAGIDCAALIAHCQLVTQSNINEVINNFVTGSTITNLITNLDQTEINSVVDTLLSKDPSNLITDRDGIYYGIVPLPNVAQQYVDPDLGLDTNDGSRANPLKTIAYAFSRVPYGSSSTINLYENKTHTLYSTIPAQANANITLVTYGTITDTFIAANAMVSCNWAWFGSDAAPRANIQFVFDKLAGDGITHLGKCIGVNAGYTIAFQGIHFTTSSVPAGIDIWAGGIGNPYNNGGMYIELDDCTVDIAAGNLVTFSPATTLIIQRLQVLSQTTGFVCSNAGNGNIEITYEAAGTMCGGYTWNTGITPTQFKSTYITGFTASPPTFDNVLSRSL